MGSSAKKVSVIIPTTCETARKISLDHAINSVVSQCSIKAELIVVVNGNTYDQKIYSDLVNNDHIHVLFQQEGNVSKARVTGLKASSGEYFCFLDDDDELLDNALNCRVAYMENSPKTDIVVTNGYFYNGFDKLLVNKQIEEKINSNIALSILDYNWFASAAPLFRRSTVGTQVFEINLKYFEWTYLFFELLSNNNNISYVNHITYRVNQGHKSASNTASYTQAYPPFLRMLKQKPLPKKIRQAIHKKYVVSLNYIANFYLKKGEKKKALKYHLMCLLNGGWRYILFTRHIILNTSSKTEPPQKEDEF